MTTRIAMKQPSCWAAAVLALALLQGCASGPNANPADPLEPFNRTMFSFNDGVDRAVLKPVATAYKEVTPALVRTGVGNFFGNISDVLSLFNNLLQFQPEEAMDSFFRVTTNTLWGLGGIFDVASDMGIPKHSQDFGLTLGHWGFSSGPYVVLPLLGPSSVRDSVGLLVDAETSALNAVDNVPARNSLAGLRVVHIRANLLGAVDLVDEVALDKYSFTRDIYLKRRESRVGRAALLVPAEERYDLPETTPATPVPPTK